MEKIAVLWPNSLKAEEWGPDRNDFLIYENIGVEKAADTAVEVERLGAKGIICTQGIKDEVWRVVSLPIHTVSIAYLDLLETLRELEDKYGIQNKRVAILLHTNNAVVISRLTPFVKNHIERFDFSEISDIPSILQEMKNRHYDVLLAGPTGLGFAAGQFSSAYLLQYSFESIRIAAIQMRIIMNLSNQELLQLQKLRAVINISPNAMVILDKEGFVNICNEKAYKIFQKRADEGGVIGFRFSQILESVGVHDSTILEHTSEDNLITIGESTYFVTWQPIKLDGILMGTVGTFEEAEKIQRMENRYRALQAKGLTAKYHFPDIICESPAMKETIVLAKAYASTDLTVLIEGETGTGKELFAQSIHNASNRRYGPFVAFNCAALSESLLESELMGYEAGAFTGARKGGKIGLLELAHNGTIFLDEINQLPMYLQSKLLRVIQERSVLRVGGERIVPIDIRIIASTNENLGEKVKRHEFRNDLYYRLNILNLQLLPLRERREDIEPLIRFFSHEANIPQENAASILRLAAESAAAYDWPGNIRELQNYVWRTGILASKGLNMKEMTAFMGKARGAGQKSETGVFVNYGTLQEMKEQIIEKAIEYCGGNRTEAAELLGISRNTIANALHGKNNPHKK